MPRPPTPEDNFFDALICALRRDRRLAQKVYQPLWAAVLEFRNNPTDENAGVRASETARNNRERAATVASRARDLDRSLPRINGTIGEIATWGAISLLTARMRPLLKELAVHADQMANRAEPRRPRGRRQNFDRICLSEWVAIQLIKAGVMPTATKAGRFAHVLAIVQHFAGFPNRDGLIGVNNVERDVRRALASASVKKYLRSVKVATT